MAQELKLNNNIRKTGRAKTKLGRINSMCYSMSFIGLKASTFYPLQILFCLF